MAYLAEIVRWITAGVTAVVDGTPRTAASVNAGLSDLANRTRWLKDRMYDLLLGVPLTISAADTTADELTVTSHGIPANSAVQVFAANGGTLPGGLSAGTVYYVGVVDADTIYLSATSGPGAAVDLVAGFSGDCYVAIIPDWLSVLLIANATYGYGKLTDLIVFLGGAQTITGTKTFNAAKMSGTAKWGLTSRGVDRGGVGPWYRGTYPTQVVSHEKFDLAVGLTAAKEFRPPNGSLLTGVTVYVSPAAHAALPANMPTLQLYREDRTTGVQGALATGSPIYTDPTTPAASYELSHGFTADAANEPIDNKTYRYYAVFTQESGANSATGQVNDITFAATVTEQDDAAS